MGTRTTLLSENLKYSELNTQLIIWFWRYLGLPSVDNDVSVFIWTG